jgi:hypothetical protein
MNETWKDVRGYEGYYQVNSLGEIKSLERVVKTHNQHGETIMKIQERVLSPGTNNHGYSTIVLYKNGGKKTFTAHRLVAIAFIPNTENKPEVNHKDGIKSHNWIANLEWDTTSENQKHAFNSDLKKPSYGNAKFTENQVKEIRWLYENTDLTLSGIARKFDSYKTLIFKIVHRLTWKHI